jgi:hypothetical protein
MAWAKRPDTTVGRRKDGHAQLRVDRPAARVDVTFGTGAYVRCRGKGRKTRCTPIHPDVVPVLKLWLDLEPAAPVFPSSRGGPLSADALQRLVRKHAAAAAAHCPSLAEKTITRPGTCDRSARDLGRNHTGRGAPAEARIRCAEFILDRALGRPPAVQQLSVGVRPSYVFDAPAVARSFDKWAPIAHSCGSSA